LGPASRCQVGAERARRSGRHGAAAFAPVAHGGRAAAASGPPRACAVGDGEPGSPARADARAGAEAGAAHRADRGRTPPGATAKARPLARGREGLLGTTARSLVP